MESKRSFRRSASVCAVYALAGPAIGGLIWGIFSSVEFAITHGKWSPSELKLLLLAVIFAYPFGFIPAALTGLVVSFIEVTSRWALTVSSAVLGGVIALVFHYFRFPVEDVWRLIYLALIPGLVAGAFLGFLIYKRTP